MSRKWNLIVDVDRCTSCNNCVLATKDEYSGNEFPGYSLPQPASGVNWLSLKRVERGEGEMMDAAYYPVTCNHCSDAPCMTPQSAGAIYRRKDGIVMLDPDKSKGRKDLVSQCPYGQIFWNEELNAPQKWNFDAHLLDSGWKQPRCTQACPTEAILAVKLTDDEMARRVAAEDLQVLQPEIDARPRIYYKNFHRTNTSFAGGTVLTDRGGVTECCEGATVELVSADVLLATATTDGFGDFRFEGLPWGGGAYTVTISGRGASLKHTFQMAEGKSVYLGALKLTGRAAA